VDDERWAAFKIKYEVAAQEKERLKASWVKKIVLNGIARTHNVNIFKTFN
jgi:hypothetical protein